MIQSSASESQPEQEVRRLLLCQQGLSDRTTAWDKGLFALCEGAAKSGHLTLIRDGDYPAFGALDGDGAYRALFDELDENGDGVVDWHDSPTEVNLVGFSWGGMDMTDIADRLGRDVRIASSRRRVAVMVLLDPFQPLRWHAWIPSNVDRVWEYRQTVTTEGDCSAGLVSLGNGFNGLPPLLESYHSYCAVYDLDSFVDNVGHCDVPSVATSAALVNLVHKKNYSPWAAHKNDCPVD